MMLGQDNVIIISNSSKVLEKRVTADYSRSEKNKFKNDLNQKEKKNPKKMIS